MKAEIIRTIDSCRVCGSKNLIPIMSFGNLYISDFVDEVSVVKEASRAPLEIVLCNTADRGCGLLQLKHTVSHEAMYRNYWYRSGINKTMNDELADIVMKVESLVDLRKGDYVIDIGSNDSTLLRFYKTPDLNTVGFEPAESLVDKYGREEVTKVITDFFNFPSWHKEYGDKKAKAITAIAMFYDLNDPNSFVADMVKCLDDDGLIIIQMLYLPSLIKRNAFDGICHEHLEYYSLFSFENLLARHGLEVFDAEFRPINEGSLRFYIRRKGSNLPKPPSGAAERVKLFRDEEMAMGLNNQKVYHDFMKRVNNIRDEVVKFIKEEYAKSKKIYVYGASTKGNTLLQYFNLDNSVITAAAERNPDKWGKYTVGTNIPIISEEQARKERPDYFLILPWHFLPEFKERESEFLKNGGKFIVPLPEFEIIGYE